MPSRVKVTDAADYISKAAPAAQSILERLDVQIRTVLPTFTPTIKWNLPFYELEKRYVSIAAYKAHVSLSLSADLTDDLLAKAKSAGYATGQKRLNIGLDQEIPTELVTEVLQLIK